MLLGLALPPQVTGQTPPSGAGGPGVWDREIRQALERLEAQRQFQLFLLQPGDLGQLQLGLDRRDDIAGYPILKLEHVMQVAVEAVSPDVRAGGRFDQLGGEANLVASLAHAAFQYIAHAQFTPDLTDVDVLPLVGEGGIARDHKQPGAPR